MTTASKNGNLPQEMGVAGFKPAFHQLGHGSVLTTNGGNNISTNGGGGQQQNTMHQVQKQQNTITMGGVNLGPNHSTAAGISPGNVASKQVNNGTMGPAQHHPPHTVKEPASPTFSVASTHCGGSPIGGPHGVPASEFSALTLNGDRSVSGMSHLDLNGTCSMTLMNNTGGAHHHFEEVSEGSDTNAEPNPTFTNKSANKPVAPPPIASKTKAEPPVHRPKIKGEAQPALEGHNKSHHCEKTQKILDEAHHFGLCDHYAKQLDQAKHVGFANVKWPTNFTLFHLAAKKNHKAFLEWLVRNDFDDLHTIDDFGKKPIDYACPRKRDSAYSLLEGMMMCVSPPDTCAERKYQAIKAGTWIDPEKKVKINPANKVNCMAAVLESADIAQGDVPAAKPSSMMTAYEAETIVPVEYKKCFKKLANGGWSAMEGNWPNQGQTVLHWAARNGKEELCHFLVLEYGADPHQEDGSGHDAMYHAKLKRHRKLAKKLLLKFKEPKSTKGKKK